MSFKELEEARSKRAAKDKATAGKKKRGRKRKDPAAEEEAPVPVADIELPMSNVVVQQQSSTWRAPVARMY